MISENAQDYYRENKIPIEKMTVVGITRLHLSAQSIEAAAEQVYNRVVGEGEHIPQIRIAWAVYALAKHLKAATDAKERAEVEAMRKRLEWLEQPWYRRAFRRFKS